MIGAAAFLALAGTVIQALVATAEWRRAEASGSKWPDRLHVISWGFLTIGALLVVIDVLKS